MRKTNSHQHEVHRKTISTAILSAAFVTHALHQLHNWTLIGHCTAFASASPAIALQAKLPLPERTIPAARINSNKHLQSTGNTTLSGSMIRLPSSHRSSQLEHAQQIYASDQLQQHTRHGRFVSPLDVQIDSSPVPPDGPSCRSPSVQPTSCQLQNSKGCSESGEHPIYAGPEEYQSQAASSVVVPSLQASSEMDTWHPAVGSCQGDTNATSLVSDSKVSDVLDGTDADRLNLPDQQSSIFGSPQAVTSVLFPLTPPDSNKLLSLELCCQTAQDSHRRTRSQSGMQVPPGAHAAFSSRECLQTALSNDEPCSASSSASAALLCLADAETFTQGSIRTDLGSVSTGPAWSESLPLQSELASLSPTVVLEEGPEPLSPASQAPIGRAYEGEATGSGRVSDYVQFPSPQPGDGDERPSSVTYNYSPDDLPTDR